MSLRCALGPVLYAASSDADTWNFHVGLLVRGADPAQPPLRLELHDSSGVVVAGPIDPWPAWDFTALDRGVYWCFSVTLLRQPTEHRLWYRFMATGAAVESLPSPVHQHVSVPAVDTLPRLVFFTCNGVTNIGDLKGRPEEALWTQLLSNHNTPVASATPDVPGPYHVLVGGGDQIYADSLWAEEARLKLSELVKAGSPSHDAVADVKPAAGYVARAQRAYIDLYTERWTKPEVARALACIPGAFTWDDHDIFDGWGSHPWKRQGSPLFQQTFQAAELAYRAFQLGAGSSRPPSTPPRSHHMQALKFSGRLDGAPQSLHVVLLDLRTERVFERDNGPGQARDTQVMSKQQWDDLEACLQAEPVKPNQHLLVVSSLPLVYLRFSSLAERLGQLLDLDDDMRDQWESAIHRGERQRLIMRLLRHGSRTGAQVTVLAGDVHVGLRARVVSTQAPLGAQRTETVLHQAVSSGIVNPPPSGFEWLLEVLGGGEGIDHLEQGVTAHLERIGANERYLRRRNFLSIIPSSIARPAGRRASLWLQWWAEDQPGQVRRVPLQKVIEPF